VCSFRNTPFAHYRAALALSSRVHLHPYPFEEAVCLILKEGDPEKVRWKFRQRTM
jgi:hypothetical protein